MAEMHEDQQFLENLIKAIVAQPDKVTTTRTVDERGVLITLDVDASDMGYVIGRRGQTARAIRTLLKIVGAKNNARVNLRINEPEGSTRGANAGYAAAANDDSDVDTSAVDGIEI